MEARLLNPLERIKVLEEQEKQQIKLSKIIKFIVPMFIIAGLLIMFSIVLGIIVIISDIKQGNFLFKNHFQFIIFFIFCIINGFMIIRNYIKENKKK